MTTIDELGDISSMYLRYGCPQYKVFEAWHTNGKNCWVVFRKMQRARIFFDYQKAQAYGRGDEKE